MRRARRAALAPAAPGRLPAINLSSLLPLSSPAARWASAFRASRWALGVLRSFGLTTAQRDAQPAARAAVQGRLDRSVLLDVLSVLVTNASTSATCDRSSVDLDGLTEGELAVAIHAAGIPANWRTLSVDQIKSLALAGIAWLGLDEIRRLNRETRALNLQPRTPANTKALRRLWTSARLQQTATDLAFRSRSATSVARAVAR